MRESDKPGVQVVPAAIAIGADQTPEAQRWKEEPSAEQYHSPSSVQAPDCAPVVVVLPLGAADAADVADATGDAASGVWLAGIGETTAVEVATGAADEVPVAKTPAESVEDGAEPEPGAEETAEGLVSDGVDVAAETEPDEGVPGATAAQEGYCRLTLMLPFVTEEPGSGNKTSTPSTVVQPLLTPARLATNIAGKLDWRLETFGAGA